jgi:hypothetical protein
MPMLLCGFICAVMDWLSQPAFHSGIFPFLVALLLSMFLRRFSQGLRGLAPIAAFFIASTIISATGQISTEALYKIFGICIAVTGMGLVLDRVEIPINQVRSILWGTGMVSALWVFLPALVGMPITEAILMGIMVTFYPAWVIWGLSEIQFRALGAYLAITSLGVGTGVAAVYGQATAVSQLSLAMGFAATSGLFLNQIKGCRYPAGYAMILPAGLTLGLLGTTALVSARLSPVSLVCLALIPLILLLIPERTLRHRVSFGLCGVLIIGIVAIAAFLAHVEVSRTSQ